MPPPLLVDLQGIDLGRLEVTREEICEVNPHRFEMAQLDGIIKYAPEQGYAIGLRNVTDQEFWVRGHIPGRPLMPGVLMLETAAQLCTYYYKRVTQDPRFLGFGGREIRSIRAVFDTQGLVDGRMVFEAIITGLVV